MSQLRAGRYPGCLFFVPNDFCSILVVAAARWVVCATDLRVRSILGTPVGLTVVFDLFLVPVETVAVLLLSCRFE